MLAGLIGLNLSEHDELLGHHMDIARSLWMKVSHNPRIISGVGRQLIQAKRVEQAVRAQYKQDMAQASKMAARAYFRKDYKDVVRLLRPYEKYLSPVDIRKLIGRGYRSGVFRLSV